MQKKISLVIICSLLMVLVQVRSGFAWTIDTHRLLSQRAAETSQLTTGVLSGLGFQNLDTEITGFDGLDFNGNQKTQSIGLWIQDGAKFEDSGTLIGYFLGTSRALNHFHDPLYQFDDPPSPWFNAGLNDSVIGYNFTGDSSLLWAQSLGTKTNSVWSWQGVRGAYYQALTLPAKTDREAHFARVFEGLGHLTHLIEDMAQPDHVRNDAHPTDDRFGLPGLEHWARVAEEQSMIITTFAQQPVPPALSMVRRGIPGDGYEPITNFWDTDTYTGAFQVTGTNVGLAEYTNANFFSDDTINSSNAAHQFPYPSVDIQNYHTCQEDPPPNSLALKRWYISRTECPPQSPRVDHFLAQSLLRDVFNQQPVAITAALQMDDRVREDYARDLIPRAVGYSAALINYFFRGELKIESVGPNEIIVRNLSGEPLSGGPLNDGIIEVYSEDASGNCTRVAAVPVSSPIENGQASNPLSLTPPPDIQKGYWAVFMGTLGAEEGAVISSFTDMVWVEDWNNGFTGWHPWWVKATDPNYQNETLPGGSFQPTTAQNGILTMTNFRPAGTYGEQENRAHIGTFSDPPYSDPYFAPYNDSFPKAVSPNTSIRIKVNAMSVNRQSPEGCSLWQNGGTIGYDGIGYNWQVIQLSFNSGGTSYTIWFTTPENNAINYEPDHTAYVYLTMSSEMQVNIYQLFQSLGFPVVEPFQLDSIVARQQNICPQPDYVQSPSEDQQQSLEMDYIRILEESGP